MPKKSGLDAAWEILFERHHILEEIDRAGRFTITSAAINTVKEARLMAKFDRSAQLPQIFRANRLSILPTARGEYVIGPFRTHREVVYSEVRPRVLEAPRLQTLDPSNLYSEAAALLYCFNSGMLAQELGSEGVCFTVNGRMSSGAFQFCVQDAVDQGRAHSISVVNAQVEIDAGYETPDCFCICEAKNMASEELLIRQLYYPWRLWTARITKPVVPLFLVFSNDLFHAFRYRFDREEDYNSLALVSHTAYALGGASIALGDLEGLWRRTRPGPEPDEPFPQADSFARVVDLLGVLHGGDLSRDEVTMKYEFDPRQTDYYIAACQYLGLAERWQGDGTAGVRLTARARRMLHLGYREKYLALMEQVLTRPVFHRALEMTLRHGSLPNKNLVIRLMLEAGLPLNETTMGRRASTVRGWIGWMLGQCGRGEQLTLD